MTEGEFRGRKNAAIASCSYNREDMVKSCLSDICDKCKGTCCKKYPCMLSPRELIMDDIDYLKNVLDTGVLTLTVTQTQNKILYIRARGVNDPRTIYSEEAITPNSCILIGKKGCILDPLYRPTDGLLLIPETKFGITKCVSHYPEFKKFEDWQKHQEILRELVEIYKNIEIDKPKADENTSYTYKLALLGNCKKETN